VASAACHAREHEHTDHTQYIEHNTPCVHLLSCTAATVRRVLARPSSCQPSTGRGAKQISTYIDINPSVDLPIDRTIDPSVDLQIRNVIEVRNVVHVIHRRYRLHRLRLGLRGRHPPTVRTGDCAQAQAALNRRI
jgi:hypothetical protein